MATPMNRGAFPYLNDREIAKMVLAEYMKIPTFYDAVAKIMDFPKGRYYSEAEITGLGELRAMGEGEAVSFDVPAEGHKKTIQQVKFGLGFQHTDEAKMDDLFNMVSKMAPSLAESAAFCREQNFWNLFNNGFSGGGVTAWDGNPVFYAHTTMKSGDTITNLGAADLSDTSLKAAFDYFLTLQKENGLPAYIDPDLLIIPQSSRYIAHDLLKSTGRVWEGVDEHGIANDATHYVGTANSDKSFSNALNPTFNVVPKWNYMAPRYIDDADSWFLVSKKFADARFYWGKKPTMSKSDDFATDNTLYKLIMRFAVAVFDYKGMYGSPGA